MSRLASDASAGPLVRRVADSLLDRPFMYRALHTVTGLRNLHARLIDDVMARFEDRRTLRVLDLGCGPGDTPRLLGTHGDYVGVDLNRRYVASASRTVAPRRAFVVGDAARLSIDGQLPFDLIIAFGLVHHLDDERADSLLRSAARLLSPRGRLITLDGCRRSDTSAVARWLLDRDRGRFVRTEPEYLSLFSRHFEIESTWTDASAMRIPYSILSVVARCDGA